jgi:leucine-zipper-like transcriptional regulator 1
MWVLHNGTSGVEVWNSIDGEAWSKVATAPFGKRTETSVVVFQGKIRVIGGLDASGNAPMDDVWSSLNGKDWVLETALPGFGRRASFGCAVSGGKIWVSGGYDLEPGSANRMFLDDVWSTVDGKSWKQEGQMPLSRARYNVELLDYGNRLWLLGGRDGSGALSDAWSSDDGADWVVEGDNALNPAGTYMAPAVFQDRIWLIGGKGQPVGLDNYPIESVRYSRPAPKTSP